jgi:hypothetical protein
MGVACSLYSRTPPHHLVEDMLTSLRFQHTAYTQQIIHHAKLGNRELTSDLSKKRMHIRLQLQHLESAYPARPARSST